jgi:chromosome partitioning protein
MNTLVFFSQKGGSGKTTLAIHIAVAAQETGEKVVLIDCDPQESAARWGISREQDTPFVAKASPENINQVIMAATDARYTLAILDCPPHVSAGALPLLATADYVIIPCQPTALDIAATTSAVTIVQASHKPFAFAINRAPHRAPENLEAQEALARQGKVCPVMVGERRAFSRALTGGQAVTEFDDQSKGAEEIRALWQWLNEEMRLWLRRKRTQA